MNDPVVWFLIGMFTGGFVVILVYALNEIRSSTRPDE
jgi:hypothetical protein